MKNANSWIYLISGIAITATVWYTNKKIKHFPDDSDDALKQLHRYELVNSSIFVIGSIAWPMVWNFVMKGFGIMKEKPLVLFGFFWPLVLNYLLLQTIPERVIREKNDKDNVESNQIFSRVGSDAMAIMSIIFALGTFLIQRQTRPNQTEKDNKHTEISRKLLFFVLIFAIGFMIPTKDIIRHSENSFAFRAIQRVFLNYSIGFVIAALAISM